MSRFLFVFATFMVAFCLTVPVLGQDSKEPDVGEKVLRHSVFFSFKEDASESDIDSVVDAFSALEESVPSIIGFETGNQQQPRKDLTTVLRIASW